VVVRVDEAGDDDVAGRVDYLVGVLRRVLLIGFPLF
jgi:hypothetical protein